MTRPYWLDSNGQPVNEMTEFAAHVREYHQIVSMERMRAFRAELGVHGGDARAARECLVRRSGCIVQCDYWRNEHLIEAAEAAEAFFAEQRRIAKQRQEEGNDFGSAVARILGAAPVTPPLCLMGETHSAKSLKKYTDNWRAKHAD